MTMVCVSPTSTVPNTYNTHISLILQLHTYTWIDHCLTTPRSIVSCSIIPRRSDNVIDHLPLCLQTRVLCEQYQPVISPDAPYGVTRRWDNLECTKVYHDILHNKHSLTCDANDDRDAIHVYRSWLTMIHCPCT